MMKISKEEREILRGGFVRLKDAPWNAIDKYIEVFIGGAGGIGSWTALYIARALYYVNSKIVICDPDYVERHNIGGQLYGPHFIGKSKVSALKTAITGFNDHESSVEITPICSRVQDLTCFFGGSINIFISAFDNMEARKFLFERYKSGNATDSIFIDGRLLAEYYQIFTLTDSQSIARYEEKHLFDDSEVDEGACTMRQTSHFGGEIGSKITTIVTNWLSNKVFGSNIRDVPFYYEHSGELMLSKLSTNEQRQ